VPPVKVAATFAIVVVGLILLRWIAAVTVSPAAPAAARSSSAAEDLPAVRANTPLAPTAEPTEDIDTLAAYDEAMRLGRESLLDDDIETAHDLYFLAVQALPGDPEAEARLRQSETVLDIDDRTSDWREALDDVEDLMALAPRSPTIGLAYTEALVGAGQEALAQGNAVRAQRLCGEASQRAPIRNDARLCVTRASGTATVLLRGTPGAAVQLAPTNTPLPAPAPTLQPVTSPTVTATPQPPTLEPTQTPQATQADASSGGPPLPQASPTPVADRP